MVSEGAAAPLSCAAAESVRLSVRLRLTSAARSLCMAPFPVFVVAMAGGSHRFSFIETRLAASCRGDGNGDGPCVADSNLRGEESNSGYAAKRTEELARIYVAGSRGESVRENCYDLIVG